MPDLWDFLVPFSALRGGAGRHTIRIEDVVQDDRYLIRAELPGVDPERDIEVMVNNGTLTIRAERRGGQMTAQRSEFRYGALIRSMSLPADVRKEDVTATYDNGILEVSFAMPDAREERTHRVPVHSTR